MAARSTQSQRGLAQGLGANFVLAVAAFAFGVCVGFGLNDLLEAAGYKGSGSLTVTADCLQLGQEERAAMPRDIIDKKTHCQAYCDATIKTPPCNKEEVSNSIIPKANGGESLSTNHNSDSIAISTNVNKPQVVDIPALTYGNVYHIVGESNSILVQPRITHRFSKLEADAVTRIMANVSEWSSQDWDVHAESIMRANVQDEILIVALSNYGMRELTMNFVASLVVHRIEKFVIVCFDLKMYQLLVSNGHERNAFYLPRHWVTWNTTETAVNYNARAYVDMLHAKLEIVIHLLSRGYRLFHTDVDVVFISPYVVKYILMEDSGRDVEFFYTVDAPNLRTEFINGGIWVARPTKTIIDMFNRTLVLSMKDRKLKIDQAALNYYLLDERPDLRYSANFSALPRMLFVDGHYFQITKQSERLRIYPMVIHANYLVGTAQKERLFRKKGFWYIGDDFKNSEIDSKNLSTIV